eukprot:scaffold15672_cov109-Isochrysis_galbana.AAC.4
MRREHGGGDCSSVLNANLAIYTAALGPEIGRGRVASACCSVYRRRVEQVRVDELGAAVGMFLKKCRGWRGHEHAARRRAHAFWGRCSWAAGGFRPHSAPRASSRVGSAA